MKASLIIIFVLICFGITDGRAQNQLKTREVKLALQLYNQALSLQQQGKYSNAVVLFEKASDLYQKHQQWKQKISCDHEISDCLFWMSKYNEALTKAKHTLSETFDKLKADTTQALYSYINIGNVLQVKGEFKKALQYHQKALKIRHSALGENHPDVADSYNSLGNVYYNIGEYNKALELHKKALQIRRFTLKENHLGTANSYYFIGNIYFVKGEYEKALEFHQKALPIRRTILGENHPDVAKSFNSLGNTYHQKGNYDKALEFHQKSLQIRRTILSENHPSVADNYYNISNVYYTKGDYDKALEFQQKSLQIRLSILGANHSDVSDSYNQLGNIFYDKGEYDNALEYYQKALDIRRVVLGESHSNVAFSYNNLGSIYFVKGEYEKALEYHQKSLYIRRSVLGESHPNVAHSYNNIANILQIKGEIEKALEYHQKALQIRQSVLGVNHPKVADSYNSIGSILQGKEDFDQAFEHYQKALQIRCSALGEAHSAVAESYNLHGVLFQAQGQHDKALEYHNKALQSYIKAFGKTHPGVAYSYNQLGKVYFNKGDYQKSLEQFQKAIIANIPSFQDTLVAHNPTLAGQASPYLISKTLLISFRSKAKILEKLFDNSHDITDLLLAYQTSGSADSLTYEIQQNFEGETDKVAFTSNAVELYQQAMPLCLKLYNLTKQQIYLNKAFYFAERGKASALLASLVESKAKTFAGIPDTLLQQDKTFRNEIAVYSQHLAKELIRGDEADNRKLTHYQNQLFDARRRQENLIEEFEKFYPTYYNLKYQPSAVTPQQLQRKLDNRTVVLEYALRPGALQVFILGQNFFKVESIPLDSLFDRQLNAFRDGIILKDPDLYQQVAYKLYQLLLPQAIPRNIKSLIIIPEGKLTSFPFEALLTQSGKVNLNRTNAYLVNKYNISYAYSGRLLYERLIQPEENPTKHLLALAPVFADSALHNKLISSRTRFFHPNPVSRSTAEINTGHTTVSSKTAINAFRKLDSGTENNFDFPIISGENTPSNQMPDGEYIAPLIASEREVKAIGQLFRAKGAKTQIYLYSKATEDQIKRLEVSDYNYIHLATHGFVNEKFPELSGLMLSQENTTQEDGILYTGEIYNLGLKADLVTLSACETGLGKLAQGEGVIGITRALLFAGAKNVLVSLWKVSDESTADLMKYFYQALLSGKSKTEALQIAKRKLVRQGRYRSPFYWAPFILIGK